jgi:WYL domain
VFPEIFGDAVREAVSAALPPDEHGWRELILSFEHEQAAAYRLAGFGAQVEVVSPAAVREQLLATARGDRQLVQRRPRRVQRRSSVHRSGTSQGMKWPP